MIGEWQDRITFRDGRVEVTPVERNMVVNDAYKVIAACMKQDPAYSGFLWWAVGDGGVDSSTEWDNGVANGTITPERTDTRLAREVYRKLILPEDISFIDNRGEPSLSITNRLQIRMVFEEDEPGGTVILREWGIFGADATEAPNSGLLINRKVHPSYEKTEIAKLERVLRFTF